jgi:hypothetical protein
LRIGRAAEVAEKTMDAITVEQVPAETGFAPVVPPHPPVTAAPTVGQVALLRTNIDPAGCRKRGFR